MVKTFFTNTADKATQPTYNHAAVLELIRVMVGEKVFEVEIGSFGGRWSTGTRQDKMIRNRADLQCVQSLILHK